MLADFTPSGIAQPGLFDEIQPHKNSEKLMKTLDERKRKLTAVCSHQTRIGNLDAHLTQTDI